MFRNCLLLLLTFPLCCFAGKSEYVYSETINPENVTIARDEWGVPHIFGKTDAEVAYGLAWANCEDNFKVIQEALALGKGVMGRIQGAQGAQADFFLHAMKAKEFVRERYEKDLTPDFRKYLEGFCQGANAYAEAHRTEWLSKKLFPVEPYDVLQTYLISFNFLAGVHGPLGKIMDGGFDEEKYNHELGSNAFAINQTLSEDGNTYLCCNPHFRIEGPLSFYEVHLQSEEGLNVLGATFQGGTSVFIGSNENLGWTQTFNYVDAVDIYRLKMDKSKKLHYLFEGKSYPLEKRKVYLKVKIKNWLPPIWVPKTTYWGKHGIVLKSKNNEFYGVFSYAYQTIEAGQEYYYMNKAGNWSEYKAALDRQGLSMFNIVYADREGNIYYLSNGLIPDRDTSVNWHGVMPGDKSKFFWDRLLPVDELPNVFNPECGYVFNCNNTPYNASCPSSNFQNALIRGSIDTRGGENNRSERLLQQLESRSTFNFDQFKKMKFDYRWSDTSKFVKSMKPLFSIDPNEHPELADVIEILNKWDLVADTNSVAAGIVMLAINEIRKKTGVGDGAFVHGYNASQELFVEALSNTKQHMLKHFGSVNVPIKSLQRFVRNGKSYPVHGFPDVLMANYAMHEESDGTLSLKYGDTYIQFASFGENGLEELETLLPFSTSETADEYANQLKLYNQLKAKPMTLDKETIIKEAVKVYQPR